MQLLLESILSLVPVEQSAQDGGEAVLSQRAHGAYQLQEGDIHGANACLCLAANIPNREIAISVSFVYLCGNLNKKNKQSNGTDGLINTSSLILHLNRKQGLNEMRQLLSKKVH